MMNASVSNKKEVLQNDCEDLYYAVRDMVTSMSGSEYIGISATIASENACMEDEIEIIN
ncbi:hypothetical protein [Polaribacter sargassicola]|uniref:hypothetical protein n=1 Tax=Polaribacter sargassicola TaxID=2836891 RepID=UPI001F2E76C2|nr:hypothetical protein [Polaribacter sp. DS7-9]MCG1035142.1 hypothetical protein [Polaribacter sp. DS7-9]